MTNIKIMPMDKRTACNHAGKQT